MAENTDFVLGPINRYFDLDDYTKPIKNYYDDSFAYKITPGLHKSVYLFMKKTTVEMSDSLIQFGTTDVQQFYNLHGSFMDTAFENPDGELLTILIQQDPTEDFYSRRVYSLLDLTGQLGGIFEVLNILGTFIV